MRQWTAISVLALLAITAQVQGDDCPTIDESTVLSSSMGGILSGEWLPKGTKDCSGNPSSFSWGYSIQKCTGWVFKGDGKWKIPKSSVEVALGISWESKTCVTETHTDTTTVPACQSAKANYRPLRQVDCYEIRYDYQYKVDLYPLPPSCEHGSYTDTLVHFVADYPEFQDQLSPCRSDGSRCCPPPTPTPCYDKNGGTIDCPPTPTPAPCYDKNGGTIDCPPTPTLVPCIWSPELPGEALPVASCGDIPPSNP